MVDFSYPYSVDWRVYKVEEETWDEIVEIPNVVSVTVDRDCTDQAPLLETSSMVIDIPPNNDFESGWYKTIAHVTQGPSCERIPIATHLYSVENETYDYGIRQISAKGRSALAPAADIRMQDGSFVPKNSNGAEWVARQLRSILKAPVRIESEGNENGFSLKRHIVYDSNDSVLSACWSVLDAGKWCLRVDGDGIVRIMKRPTTPSFVFTDTTIRFLYPGIKKSSSKDEVPNRYVARDGGKTVIVVNDDPESETSTVATGRRIDAPIDTNPYLMQGESIEAYAKRKLEEVSTISVQYDYTREYIPELYPLDMYEATIPLFGMDGEFRVAKQKLTLDMGIEVSETATQEIKYWRRT